ncbi:dephospho-CoA kinase [Lactobacillus sp. Sy-1]|uniref:dephospho-CoA kinase n=1 Tax=Lactobacillus sp. Sy-1 TaxID=2109645 RepID=UPI001C599092|nr:dephospho-CoA kinase [Lactobacillus sp. Sy-1]MBW1605702.1 dephospho-CoA kinase [Lactobacillus sp. Sy-1]
MTKIIGLTGSVGTGKSTASKQFNASGFPVVDADAIAHEQQQRGTECYYDIVDLFGMDVVGPTSIDRKKLAEIVFSDKSKLRQLNRTMDLYIRREVLRQLKDYIAQSPDFVILDAPLLFELGYEAYVDVSAMVVCEPEIQIDRIKKRNQIDTAAAVNLIGQQWSQSMKRDLADAVIDNSGSIMQTSKQVLELLESLL